MKAVVSEIAKEKVGKGGGGMTSRGVVTAGLTGFTTFTAFFFGVLWWFASGRVDQIFIYAMSTILY